MKGFMEQQDRMDAALTANTSAINALNLTLARMHSGGKTTMWFVQVFAPMVGGALLTAFFFLLGRNST